MEKKEGDDVARKKLSDEKGDGAALVRPYQAQTPTKYRLRLDGQSVSQGQEKSDSDQHTRAEHAHQQNNTHRNVHDLESSRLCSVRSSSHQSFSKQEHSSASVAPKDFHHEVDFPSVSIRHVNVAQRSAFAIAPLMSVADHKALSISAKKHKVSPSLEHLQLLHRLRQNTQVGVVRQLQFSASVGLDADALHHLICDDGNIIGIESDVRWRGVNKKKRRDGRYRSIDPIATSIEKLPVPPPALSHSKARLPNRSDVGFPGATPDNFEMKQNDIRHETAWEESSPRLVVLVTSECLGSAVSNDQVVCDPWNDLPLAGRDLKAALCHNGIQFESGERKVPREDTESLKCKLNTYSMLSPPLDAAYSASQGWRPRLFHDRPAGMNYCVACPTLITPSDRNEALVCSLTLYTLPPIYKGKKHSTAAEAAAYHCKRNGHRPAYGKISERFWFPAGKGTDADYQEDLYSILAKRPKAVFAYNPLDLVMEKEQKRSLDQPPSLYIVLQTYKHGTAGSNLEFDSTRNILVPLSFGVTRFFSSKEGKRWPDGYVKDVALYMCPEQTESEAMFLERLWSIIQKKSTTVAGASLIGDDSTISSIDQSDAADLQNMRKGIGNRLFRSPPSSRSRLVPAQQSDPTDIEMAASSNDSHTDQDCAIAHSRLSTYGKAKIFLSALGHDFLQTLLVSPASRVLDGQNASEKMYRQILVDITGDFAVATSDDSPENIVSPTSLKRSSLVRLESPLPASRFSGAADFREILYLPARPDKNYDVDCQMASSRCSLNLLYLYPHLLRLSSNSVSDHRRGESLTVQVHVLRIDEKSSKSPCPENIVCCFHSPFPWISNPRLQSAFTSIYAPPVEGMKAGIHLREEIKIQLPFLLHGQYRLHFCLFSVGTPTSPKWLKLSEATVPLSSTSAREDVQGSRTVIPNGKHRLELGEFQLHFETRLISSFHVGDAAVATALRKLPYGKKSVSNATELKVKRSTSNLSVLRTEDMSPLAMASEHAVAMHFLTFVYLHFTTLVESSVDAEAPKVTAEKIMSSIQSFFHVLEKVKLMSSSRYELVDAWNNGHTSALMKACLDMFDEYYLCERPFHTIESKMEEEAGQLVDGDLEDQPENLGEEAEDVSSVSTKKNKFTQRRRENEKSRVSSTIAPFARVAFGASKIDRMKAEAETRNSSGHFAPFFDDDETIATAPSIGSGRSHKVLRTEMSINTKNRAGKAVLSFSDENSITGSKSAAISELRDERYRSISETDFAKRVKTAASVMLAPCVGPTLSNMLQPRGSSPRKNTGKTQFTFSESEDHDSVLNRATICLCSPGSDVDENYSTKDLGRSNTEPSKLTAKLEASSNFRGVPGNPLLSLSVPYHGMDRIALTPSKYLYESLILSWLKAWSDYIDVLSPNQKENRFETVSVPPFDSKVVVNEGTGKLVYDFFLNIDFLLPLCLKSIALRYNESLKTKIPPFPKAFVDSGHVTLLKSLVTVLAQGLVSVGSNGLSASQQERSLCNALHSSSITLDFFIGLMGVLHPQHMHTLLSTYFQKLRFSESQCSRALESSFESRGKKLHGIRCCRQLRINAAEKLAVMPCFLALNFPSRYSNSSGKQSSQKPVWHDQDCAFQHNSTKLQSSTSEISNKLPKAGWLADLVVGECLSVCAVSSESVVAEAISYTGVGSREHLSSAPSVRMRLSLKRDDLLMLQTLAIHAITIVYEMVIRRNAMDRRFQSESARARIAGMLARCILNSSVSHSHWLAKLGVKHKVRTCWLMCLMYVLQEAPEAIIHDVVIECIDLTRKDIRIYSFIRLLNLSSSTFQCFLKLSAPGQATTNTEKVISPWLFQESFNTLCATANVVVETCMAQMLESQKEREKTMTATLKLFLKILSTSQSSVTQMRAVAGSLAAVEFDVNLFLNAIGADLEHWVRIMLSLMNSMSLSVRSIAVDFVVSLLGGAYDVNGTIDVFSVVFATVLPEVIAREIALYSVDGHINTMKDLSKAVWPIRRSIADLEDSNPLDDDRVDPLLAPEIAAFCRGCQAVVDGVLVEIRLSDRVIDIAGTEVCVTVSGKEMFDADEESVYEAASFFIPESSPLQRIRWFLTLQRLHESKKQWVEAAESLLSCAFTICESIPHLKAIWRPERFGLWFSSDTSAWLQSVGKERGFPDRGNREVMDFASQFLEPISFLGIQWKPSSSGKLSQPTMQDMCSLLNIAAKKAIELYSRESGMDELAKSRVEVLFQAFSSVADEHKKEMIRMLHLRASGFALKQRLAEEEKTLQKNISQLRGAMSDLALGALSASQNEFSSRDGDIVGPLPTNHSAMQRYVRITLHGKKPPRFQESTSIPTFMEWEKPCICRVPATKVESIFALSSKGATSETICFEFVKPLLLSLQSESTDEIVVRTESATAESCEDGVTYVDVMSVEILEPHGFHTPFKPRSSQRFFHRSNHSILVETTVAREFPCAISRQSALITTEISSK